MSLDLRWMWRILACLGAWACSAFAGNTLDGYLRHRATGDQTGFALGMALLVFGLVPATSSALVLGTTPGSDGGRPGLREWLARLAVAIPLAASAAFFFTFPTSLRATVARDVPPGHANTPADWSFALAEGPLIAFAVFQVACATAFLWPVVARTWWFSAILFAVGVAALAAVAAAVSLSGPATLAVAVPWLGWGFAAAWAHRTGRRFRVEQASAARS